ncbi:hypothetical protein BY996DRAFT_6413502 [Phakopsora pachyrhizi]|nr:hypothetical protein BY996DRAFT_6413502 [Phakopsora pachyrhizi]
MREDLPDPPSYTDPSQLLQHTNNLSFDSDWIDYSIDHQDLQSLANQIKEEANTKKTVVGGATDEHSVGGGEDMINENAEAEGSLLDLQAQPAAKSEHIHPSESDSQHNYHHSEDLAQDQV